MLDPSGATVTCRAIGEEPGSSGWGSRVADGQTTVWFELRAVVA